jgi:hypothetical protein
MEDILYTIMLELSFKDVMSYLVTNKLAASVDTNNFWLNKFKQDFKDVQLSNIDNYKQEYHNMYKSVTTSTQFVTMLELIVNNSYYICIPRNINIKNIYWLPKNITDILQTGNIIDDIEPRCPSLYYSIDKYPNKLTYKSGFDYFTLNNCTFHREINKYSRIEFIDIFANFLYYYPDIKLTDNVGNILLYKDLANNVGLTNREQCILKIYDNL